MPRTIQDAVTASGMQVADEELVNFGFSHRDDINPATGPRSYWFRFADIAHLTLPQVQAAIGELASAGQRGAKFMRACGIPLKAFVLRPGIGFFGLDEYTIDVPVMVRFSIEIR
ncbi:MAG: hypothetical protein WD872_02620 [Pirellulaceae bacterium]